MTTISKEINVNTKPLTQLDDITVDIKNSINELNSI